MNLSRLNTIAARWALALAVLLCLVTQVVRAAPMDQSMNAQFNAMMNVTAPGVYETQAAKVISGGSFVYRPKVAQLRLVAFDPPRLRADCNGIDAYAGSLSFISKEAFINFLRNLAAAAPAFAFNMALSYLCKDCDQHLARIQKLAQDMNALTINSCKIDAGDMAKKVRSVADDIDDIAGNDKSLGNYLSGISTDYFGPKKEPGKTQKDVREAAGSGNTSAQRVMERVNLNIAASAAARTNLSDWWGAVLNAADKKEFNEVTMSFHGTIVTIQEPTDEDPSKETDKTYFLTPLLKFTDFIYGGPREIYKCPDTECMIKPTSEKQTKTIPGFLPKVEELLIGNAGEPGIIRRLNARESTGGLVLSDDQKRFITGLPGGVYAHLRELATNPGAAETYARTLSVWIASEMAFEYLAQIVQNARVTADQSKAALQQKEWIAKLDEIDKQIIEDRARFSDTLKAQQANLTIAQLMRENLSRAVAVGLRPITWGPSN